MQRLRVAEWRCSRCGEQEWYDDSSPPPGWGVGGDDVLCPDCNGDQVHAFSRAKHEPMTQQLWRFLCDRGMCSCREIAAETGIKRRTVSQLLSPLCRRGIVIRMFNGVYRPVPGAEYVPWGRGGGGK